MPRLLTAGLLPLCLALPTATATLAQDPPPSNGSLDIEAQRARMHFARFVAEEEARFVPVLWELAGWCKSVKLFRERARLCRGILAMDPTHRGARTVLRYIRYGSEWRQAKSYRTPRNRAPEEVLEDYRRRLDAAAAPFRARIFRRLERERALLGPDLREAELRKLLLLDPDDAALRTVLGEVRLGERWVLAETAAAAEGGARIGESASLALEGVDFPEKVQLTEAEERLQLLWRAARATPRVRVLGTTSRSEVEETTRVTDAVGNFFTEVFGRRQPHRRGYTIYLLEGPQERDLLMGGLGGIDVPTQTLLRQASGGWLGNGYRLGEWDPDPARRLDGAARQTLGTLLMDAYGVDGRHGWAWEGMGLYLVYRLVGTRKTYFIQRGAYARQTQTTLWPKLQSADTDWLREARALLATEVAPDLPILMGRGVDTMRDEDLLAAYALSAYLLEGRPDDVPRILRGIGAGEHPVVVFERVTGYSVPQLEGRLRRWLDEVLK